MTKNLVLGAGFGGLELCTLLSEALGDSIKVTLIDRNDHFVFGFSKLDIMFAMPSRKRAWPTLTLQVGRQANPTDHNQN